MVNTAMKLKEACYLGEKIMTNLDSILKKQKHYVADKDPFSQNYGFSAKNRTRLSARDSQKSYSGAAATAKLLQSCPTPCDPIDESPPGSPVPGILQARILEWVAISFSNA